jgi:pimeloyl-ACP methyl ester carboxylesterase
MSPRPAVLLLHGLWMHRPALLPLAWRLRRAGFEVRTFGYASLAEREARVLQRLDAVIAAHPGVHLVGHSLGGLYALAAASARPEAVGRVLCLGTPIAGSAVAERVSARAPRWAAAVLGHSRARVLAGVPAWPVGLQVGMLAGVLPRGLGQWSGALSPPHDGTVRLVETRVAGLADHRSVAVSHSGLLVSAEVAGMAAAFLRTGRFPRNPADAWPASRQ